MSHSDMGQSDRVSPNFAPGNIWQIDGINKAEEFSPCPGSIHSTITNVNDLITLAKYLVTATSNQSKPIFINSSYDLGLERCFLGKFEGYKHLSAHQVCLLLLVSVQLG